MIRPAIDRKKDAADLAFKRHAYAVQNFQNEGGRGWRRTLCFWSGSSMDDFTREVIQATAVISINTMLPYAIWSDGGGGPELPSSNRGAPSSPSTSQCALEPTKICSPTASLGLSSRMPGGTMCKVLRGLLSGACAPHSRQNECLGPPFTRSWP